MLKREGGGEKFWGETRRIEEKIKRLAGEDSGKKSLKKKKGVD